VSGLFIHPYFDEDVDVLVATLVRSRGFDATTTRDAGRLGSDDEQQLAHAAANGWTLFTHNRVDFERLARRYLDSGKSHGGIIIAVRRPAAQIARRLLILLNQVAAEEMIDQVRYI
jgi:predicted nuclease of predicted toxin-antitoxin system